MSEIHEEENKSLNENKEEMTTVEEQTKIEDKEPAPQETSVKKGMVLKLNKSMLNLALCAAIGLGTGYIGSRLGRSSSLVYQSSSVSPSKTTSVNSTTGLTLSEAAQKAAPSVVEIRTEAKRRTYGFLGGQYSSSSAGSGVIISKDGYIITNHHVVAGASAIQITTSDGKTYQAKLIASDQKSDIAVLKVDAKNLVPATLGDSSKIAIGNTAIAIGNPLGTLGGTVTDGIISATSRNLVINNQAMDLIQTNATINSGNSGGGLFDGNGNLIGIVNAKDSGTTSSGANIEGLGFAIPINKAMDVANELIKNGKVTSRATIGVSLQTVPEGQGNIQPGLYIQEVLKNSGAEKAGLQAGDRIVKADNTDIKEYSDIAKIMKDKKPGDTLSLEVERGRETVQVTVHLTQVLDQNS